MVPSRAADAKDAAYRWVILAVIYVGFISTSVVFQSIPPVLSLIIGDLDLTHTQAGLLMSLYALPGIFLAIPIGLLTDRFNPKYLFILCLLCAMVGSLMVYTGHSFIVLALGRLIAGAGGGSIFVVGAPMVAHWFVGREQGLAAGIYSTGLPVGTILALNTFGLIAVAFSWHGAILVSAILAAFALVLFWVLFRPAPSGRAIAHTGHPWLTNIFKLGLPIWLVSLAWLLFNAASISFLTFGPDYFLSRGFGIGFAGFLASFLVLLSPPLAPLVGVVIDRVGGEQLLIAVGGIIIALGIIAVLYVSAWLIPVLLVLSLGNVLVPTAVFSLPPKLLSPSLLGAGYGLLSTFVNAGSVLGPFLTGFARDQTGSYEASFYVMAFFGLMVAVTAGALSRVCCPAPRD